MKTNEFHYSLWDPVGEICRTLTSLRLTMPLAQVVPGLEATWSPGPLLGEKLSAAWSPTCRTWDK